MTTLAQALAARWRARLATTVRPLRPAEVAALVAALREAA